MYLIILTLVAALLAVAYCRTRGPVTAPGPVGRLAGMVADEGRNNNRPGSAPMTRRWRGGMAREPETPGQRQPSPRV